MNYELAKKLKDAGFPQKGEFSFGKNVDEEWESRHEDHWDEFSFPGFEEGPRCPTLSELIEAVGFCFATLQQEHKNRTPEGYLKFSGWKALAVDCATSWVGKGLTPEIAVAELWLNIKNNVYECHEPFMQEVILKDVFGITPLDCGPTCLRCGAAPCPCGVKRIIKVSDYFKYGIHPEDTKKCTDSGHTIKVGDSCLCGQNGK